MTPEDFSTTNFQANLDQNIPNESRNLLTSEKMAKIWNEGVLELEEEEQSIEMKSCKDKKEDLFFGDMEGRDPIDKKKFPIREKRASEGINNYNYKRTSTGNSGVNKSVNNENMIQGGGVGNVEGQGKNPGGGS